MKTVNLIITLVFVLASALASAEDGVSASTSAASAPAVTALTPTPGGFVSLEAVYDDGVTVVRGEVITPSFPDDRLRRAACCVQPEQGKLQINPIISAIETLASRFTSKMLVVETGRFVDVCDKVNFIVTLNSLGVFDEIKKEFVNGVVLRVHKDTVSKTALVCLAK